MPPPPLPASVPEHRDRARLVHEAHARPPMRLAAPAKVSHLVMLSGEAAADDERAHLALLCDTLDVPLPGHGVGQYFVDLGLLQDS